MDRQMRAIGRDTDGNRIVIALDGSTFRIKDEDRLPDVFPNGSAQAVNLEALSGSQRKTLYDALFAKDQKLRSRGSSTWSATDEVLDRPHS